MALFDSLIQSNQSGCFEVWLVIYSISIKYWMVGASGPRVRRGSDDAEASPQEARRHSIPGYLSCCHRGCRQALTVTSSVQPFTRRNTSYLNAGHIDDVILPLARLTFSMAFSMT